MIKIEEKQYNYRNASLLKVTVTKNDIDSVYYVPKHECILYNDNFWNSIALENERYNDFVAKELQQKIANDYGFDKFIDELAEKNGITNY